MAVSLLLFHLLYNDGRTGIFAAIGTLGSAMVYSTDFDRLTHFVLVSFDLFVIFIGFGTTGMFRKWSILRFEMGSPVRIMTRVGAKLKRLPVVLRALPPGALMWFLPCGFLYAMFLTAFQTANPRQGAITMLLRVQE